VTLGLLKGHGRRLGAALLLAVGAAVCSCSASTHPAQFSAPPPVTSRTSFDGQFYFTPRPESASATSLTASRAWGVMARGRPIPAFETAQYGVLTDKVSHLTREGNRVTHDRYRDRPVWAFSTLGLCPASGSPLWLARLKAMPPPHSCVVWYLLDASTAATLAVPEQDVNSPSG
jgi:hypothetical protein